MIRFTTLAAAAALLLGNGYALAAESANETAPPHSSDASGRPTAILDNAKCASLWSQASKGDNGSSPSSGEGTSTSLSFDQARPYIVNFAMVDKNNDRLVSQAEFQDGCKNGWIQAAAEPNTTGGGESQRTKTGG
jgi:hypothetical protein